MLQTSLSLALLGLGAVQALPTKTTTPAVENRSPQTWGFGPPSTSLTPGDPHSVNPSPSWPSSGPFLIPGLGGGIDTGDGRKCDWSRGPCFLRPGDRSDGTVTWSPPSTSSSSGSTSTSEDDSPSTPEDNSDSPSTPPEEEDGGSAETWQRRRDGPQLPPDRNQHRKDRIARLEVELEELQNKPHKSDRDWDEIDRLHDELARLAGVDDIYAPPGSSSTFTPGRKARRQEFTLPTDGSQSFKDFIAGLEERLERLQNKEDKSRADWAAIRTLREVLFRVAGVSQVSAPDGGSTTLTPGR